VPRAMVVEVVSGHVDLAGVWPVERGDQMQEG